MKRCRARNLLRAASTDSGDRLFVQSDCRIKLYNNIDKTLNPIDRVLRSVLLGSATVNSIRQRGTGTGGMAA